MMNLIQYVAFLSSCFFICAAYATCPQSYDDMGLNINGQTKVRVDWVGEKAKTKNGIIGVAGTLCFSPDGKTCKGEFGVELNTGSETEIFQDSNDPNQKVSVCMGYCARSRELPFNSNESPDWRDLKSCLGEFKVSIASLPDAPTNLSDQGKKDFIIFLNAEGHKAFAFSAAGAYGYQTNAPTVDAAKKDALAFCNKYTSDPCEIYMIDNELAK